MPTEVQRNRLFNALTDKLGAAEAATMMELLPPVGWADVATKQDLENLRVATSADIRLLGTELRAEMAALGAGLRAETAELGAGLRAEMAALGAGLRAELKADTQRFTTWLIGTQVAIIGAIVGLGVFG